MRTSTRQARELAHARFLLLFDELKSRAWALSKGLSPADREDHQAEILAWAWSWLLRAARHSTLSRLTAFTIAHFGNRLYRSGRRFGSSDNCRDVMSPIARARGKVSLTSIDDAANVGDVNASFGRSVVSALTDSRHPRPDEATRCAHDYGLLKQDPSLSARAVECFSHILEDPGRGHVKRTAQAMRVSMPRVCELKRQLADGLARLDYAPSSYSPSNAA